MAVSLFQTCACYYPQDVGSQTYGPFAVETISIDTAVEDVIVRDFSLTYNKRVNNYVLTGGYMCCCSVANWYISVHA